MGSAANTNYRLPGHNAGLVSLILKKSGVQVTFLLDPNPVSVPVISLRGKGHHGVGDTVVRLTPECDLTDLHTLVLLVLAAMR